MNKLEELVQELNGISASCEAFICAASDTDSADRRVARIIKMVAAMQAKVDKEMAALEAVAAKAVR